MTSRSETLLCFFPNGDLFYEAYNKSCPNHFLAEESLENFRDEKKQRLGIIGMIIEIQEESTSHIKNPYKMKEQGKYYEVNIIRMI